MKSLKILAEEFGQMTTKELYVYQDTDIIGLSLTVLTIVSIEPHSANMIKISLEVDEGYEPPDTLLFWSLEGVKDEV